MRKSNELQIGKAGEYIVCADLIIKGLIAFPSEQGLPYDVVIDNGKRLIRCQVKTTTTFRSVPQRKKESFAYVFSIKRCGKGGIKRCGKEEAEVFALVELDTKSVAYIKNEDLPTTINIRVDRFRGTYYDEKGIADFNEVKKMLESGITQTQIANKLNLHISQVNRMAKDGYAPFKSKARYFSDFIRNKEWFESV